eukprot:5025984-Karenia_brevis.AAC.1
MRTERQEVKDPLCSMISDSKGLYDALNSEWPQDDKRSATETPMIEEQMKRMHGRCRWVPRNDNPVGALTKLKGAHPAPLMALLRTGVYWLKTEEAQLASRAEEKEGTGKNARHKRMNEKEDNQSYQSAS